MALNTKQREVLVQLARRLIDGLAAVDEAAKAALASRRESPAGSYAVATVTNAMVHGGPSEVQSLAAISGVQAAELAQLRAEPFIARVVAEDENGARRTYYFARSMPLAKASVGNLDGPLASYRSAVGRLAERSPGDEVTLRLKNVPATLTVVERVRLSPSHMGDEWDGRQDRIESDDLDLVVTLDSLREFLAQFGPQPELQDLLAEIEAAANQDAAIHEGLRRRVIERISLRDEAVLDQYQGEVFRLPLNRRLMLSGPPGTGKTTTLIKRIAQKTRIDEVTDEERDLAPSNAEELFRANNWVMYTPTELLKLYLKEAFARESVAASDLRVRTWTDERRRLGREVLRVLRSENAGQFTLDDDANTLADLTSTSHMKLADAFVAAFEAQVVARYGTTLSVLVRSEDTGLAAVAARMKRKAGDDKITFRALFELVDFHADLANHEQRLEAASTEQIRSIINALLNKERTLVDSLANALDTAAAGGDEDEDEEDADLEEERPAAPRDRKQAALLALRRAFSASAKELHDGKTRTRTGRNRHVLDWLGARAPAESALRSLGAILVTLERVRFLGHTYRNLIEQVPTAYQRFRRNSLKAGQWYRPEARGAIEKRRVVGAEVDVMLLPMLRNAGQFLRRGSANALRFGTDTRIAVLDAIKGEYVTQVLVDEATDFSPVQLACMQELARPEFRSFFVCGDVRQRITPWGVRSLDELQWIASDFEVKEITIGYRQSKRLAALAGALSRLNGGTDTDLKPPPHVEDADIPPVLGEELVGEGLARWLSERVREVERALKKVPSIAIFVDGDAQIDPLVKVLRPLLIEHNHDVVGCKEGKVVGTDGQVRVFDVQHIKGLEFEAVFFVGVDALSRRVPDLFDKYLFVGSTRAATYLGLTCEGRLPDMLQPVRSHFSTGGW